ncbi:SusC/RagA family TonB-linked outer membrane protein [Pedobacter sp. MC2016-24]|uniref:SusC/RagA family TonB-linked outer membrane protein n=1 Tax=Pedobacter sp. MC2016-24 TaxID=2780090 RepID=UPI00187FB61A|nr:SusC/RagA family TonB-linked outer membrane protein [Pedobacter sp. MC2016-24]MBE9602183.1 SusC/RagA family TonB-linked outer membrane protein [Pedobacter sp. MC2016-24]
MNFYIQLRYRRSSCTSKKPVFSTQTIMRINLTCLLLLLTLLQVSAGGFAQKISLSKNNITLQQLFKEIKTQSGFDFLYQPQDLKNAKRIDINVKGAELKSVLDDAFSRQPLVYSIDQNTIVVRKKGKTIFGTIEDFFKKFNIAGSIIDDKGNPLAGATVRLKNSNRTVVTNAMGKFQLADVDEGAVLVVSFIGYKTKEIVVGKSVSITIVLDVLSSELEAVSVVSTGYQSLPKERATGAINVISGDQLDKPTTNISQRLIGTTAGMQATLDADGNPRFEIRGQTSLTANARPLVVVDGFAIQGDFNTINPNDVESVTILKDAAAASIWGARSANGVIVVITKKVKKGIPLRVNFSAFTKISGKLDLDYVNPLASSAETIDYEMKSFGNWSAQINSGSLATDNGKAWSLGTTALSEYALGFITLAQRDALLAKYKTLSNKDQIRDELLTSPAAQQYNLNLSGSTSKMSNNLSLLYEDTKSNFKGTNDKKYNFNYRANAEVFKWLEFTFSAMVNYNKINSSGVNLSDIQGLSPYEMLRNDDGSLTNIARYYTPIIERFVPTALFPYADWSYNPIQEIANRKVTAEQLNTRLQTGLRFKILKGLSFDTKLQYELFNTSNKAINNENTFAVRNAVNTAVTWDQVTNKITLNLPKGGTLTQSRARAETYNFRSQINFDRRFNEKHEVNFVGGSEINNIVSENFGNPTTYGFNEQTLSVGTFPNGPGGTFFPIKNWLGSNQTFGYSNSYSYSTDRYLSLFGNAAYTYNNKYTISGSIRTDASNLITDDPSYRYAPFWSAGFGWQLSKEPFIKDVIWVDRLNVRATYGYNGNVDRSTSFRPLIAMGAIPNTYTGDVTATVSSFGNPTLRWEKTGTWNLGLDYSLFHGKLYGKLDVYNKSGKDLIATLSIPAVNGTTSQKLNNAEMTNKGIELELGTMQQLKDNDIVWRGNVNFSYNKNKITKLFVANYAASTLVGGGTGAYVEGLDANTLWRFRYAGMQNGQPMVTGAGGALYDFGAFTPGDGRDYLLNMGTAVAPYTLGFINSFKVYDFDFSFVVTGKFGHKFQRMGFNYPPTWTGRVLPNNKLSEVTNGNPNEIVPLPQNLIEPRYYFWDRFHQNLSYLIESASHIRMQEVNLSYNVPQKVLSKIKMSRLQVFAQGNDLFTLVANNAGEDPEYRMGTLKPQPRVSLGFKCEF